MDTLNATTKLRRFCFLGSFKPIYVYHREKVDVAAYWPQFKNIFQNMNDKVMLSLMKEIMLECTLPRMDECLFVYAAYLASNVDIRWRTALRNEFPTLITNDDNLFLFCKYASLIAKEENRKGFSKTVRKAITSWYTAQSANKLRSMWMSHRGNHGFTHKVLIKLCHIPDASLGMSAVSAVFFKTCTQLLKESDTNPSDTPNESKVKSLDVSDTTDEAQISMDLLEKTTSSVELSSNIIVSMSKLRTTKSKHEVLRIIRKFSLAYKHVPQHWWRYAAIMEALIPTMPPLKLLKCWRSMAHFNHLDHPRILKLCQKKFENSLIRAKYDIYPITFLINLHKLGIKGDTSHMAYRKVEAMKMPYINHIYKQSFAQIGKRILPGGIRMHITINLQKNYKKKLLRNQKKLTFYDASIVLAFGYFKREALVDVFYWTEDKMKLSQISWTKDMDIEAAFTHCNQIQNLENNQRLIIPILNALSSSQVYDVFLCIVPTAGRGNPKQCSEYLCTILDKYRETKNPNTKFIILELLKFRQSMSYSNIREENILEICGLNENTTDIIKSFLNNRFN